MTGMAPEPSPRFWRHPLLGETWLTLSLWVWGPGTWLMAWMDHQAPGHDSLFRLLVTLRVVSFLGFPVALIAVVRQMIRRFALAPIGRLAGHTLVLLLSWLVPDPPLLPEQEWHAQQAKLQAMADAAMSIDKGRSVEDGPWRAFRQDSEVIVYLQGFDRYPLVYAPLGGHAFVTTPSETTNRYLIRDIAPHWYLVRQSLAW